MDDYREHISHAMEELTEEVGNTRGLSDAQILYVAAAKIKLLKTMLRGTGVSQGIIDAVMREAQVTVAS